MTFDEWDAYVTGLADSDEVILGKKFEEDNGLVLARILATIGWPSYRSDRVYAKAGDDSNTSLRRLQRKYQVALKLLAASEHTAATNQSDLCRDPDCRTCRPAALGEEQQS